MSDNYFDRASASGPEPDTSAAWEPGSLVQVPAATTDHAPDWRRLVDCLPLLGPLLWLHRTSGDLAFPRARLLPEGVLLLDHPALAAFADSASLRAHGAITAHGPREWLEFRGMDGACLARLYLLPDADYLAWDAMLAECRIARVQQNAAQSWYAHSAFMRCAFARLRTPWQARVVRLPLLRLPCLQVLGLRPVDCLSDLGRQLAMLIATDEHADLQAG